MEQKNSKHRAPKYLLVLLDLFSCPIDTLETQWRNVTTAGFSDDQDIDKFWLEVEAFKDAGGHKCFQELAQGAICPC